MADAEKKMQSIISTSNSDAGGDVKIDMTAGIGVGDFSNFKGATRRIDDCDDEFSERGCFCNLLCCPLNLIKDIIAYLLIVPLVVIIIILVLLLVIYGQLLRICSKAHRAKLKRFGSFKAWLRNKLLTSFRPFWMFCFMIPLAKDKLNILVTTVTLSEYVTALGNLPRMNMEHDYTCLDVYDKAGDVYSRSLPRASKEWLSALPPTDKVAELFVRQNGEDETKKADCEGRSGDEAYKYEANRNSSLLLAYYAQWLTHQFFNTNPSEPNKTNQNVGFNLSQLYGSDPNITKSVRLFKGGLLRSQIIGEKEWLPVQTISYKNTKKSFLEVYKRLGLEVEEEEENKKENDKEENKKEENAGVGLDENENKEKEKGTGNENEEKEKKNDKKFMTSIELSNFTPGFMAIQTLWFRHHQYIARTLSAKYPSWDDERLFEIAKLINLLCVFNVTISDYVITISNKHGITRFNDNLVLNLFKSNIFRILGPSRYATSIYAISAEFNILYRWHQMIPNKIKIMKSLDYNKKEFDNSENANDYVEMNILGSSVDMMVGNQNNKGGDDDLDPHGKYEDNLERILLSASCQHAGKLCLHNTRPWLARHVVKRGLDQCRHWGLQGYNDYRRFSHMKPLDSFNDLTDDEDLVTELKELYDSDINKLEYYPGIFAGKKDDGGFHAPLLTFIGAGYTFLGLFSIPVLKEQHNILNLIKPIGLKILNECKTIDELAALHTNLKPNSISFFAKTPVPSSSKKE